MGYWQTRFEQLEKKTFQITKQNSADIQKALIAAERSIKKDINNWIVRFAKNNEVSIVEARKMLNNDELKEFKWDVKEFIKYGEENALNQEYMKELENASARFHISRLEAIELSIRNEFEKAYKIQDDKIRQNVLETYDDRYYRTCYEVQSKFGIGFDVSGVDTDKVKKLISKPWASDNKTFSDRVWTKKNEMIDTLRSQLIRTCATGGNIQDAVNSMMSFVSKDVKNARYAATRLMQTETAFFSSVSEKKALKDLDVEQYEILATLDSKTSPICQEMDGQVFKLSEYEIGATAPPFHVNCRSTTCPHFDDEYGERVARDRAGNTYMVPGDMTYKEWRAKQDEKSDLMSNSFRPRYEDRVNDEKIEKTNIKSRKVENSKFDLYVDEDYADKRNKAVRNTEKLLNEISKSIDTNTFEIGKVVLTDLGKIHKAFENAIGMYNKLTDTIYINAKYDTNDKIIDYLNKKKDYFANNDKLTPLKHEMGHKFYEKCLKKLAKKDNIDYNKAKDIIDNKIFTKIRELNVKDSELFLIDNLSKYAYNNYKVHKYTEVIAECLTLYKESSLANSIIGELLEE